MSLLNLVRKVGSHTPEPFLAPVPDADQVTLFTYQNDIPYFFRLSNPKPGWWMIRPRGTVARIERDATVPEYMNYKRQLKTILCISLFPVGNDSVMVCPFNLDDAKQRGWDGSPRIAHVNQDRTVSLGRFVPLEVASPTGFFVVKSMATKHLTSTERRECMKNFALGNDGVPFGGGWGLAYAICRSQQKEVARLARQQEIARQQETVEGRLKRQLEVVGAELVSSTHENGGYRVSYRFNDAEFSVPVTRQGRVLSAGICLSGRARDYDLSSIVLVMQEARQQHRYDLDRGLWI